MASRYGAAGSMVRLQPHRRPQPPRPRPTDSGAAAAARLGAPGSAEPALACGTAITHRIGFQGLAELLDATLSHTATDPFDLYTDPADLGPGLAATIHVLDQPDLEQAAAAAWMLPLDGTHAPTRPVLRIAQHHYNPLLAAIQLTGVHDRLPPAEQLTFRTGHPAPRYPTATTRKTRCRLRLPDHHPSWPEPDPAWIPQTLWWNTIPAPLLHQPDPALRPRRGSMLAMALARTGTTRDWDTIGTDLHLPASHAHQIEEWIADTRHTGTWPILLTRLERLLTGLQQHPPPINYPARRRLGNNLDLITDAVLVGRQRHPAPPPSTPSFNSSGNASPAATSPTHPNPFASARPPRRTPRSDSCTASQAATCSTSPTSTSSNITPPQAH